MSLIHTAGNLLNKAVDGEFDIIIHGCNCFNTFGAGIALEIKNRFPPAYESDKRTISGDINKLGNFTEADINTGDHTFKIINAYTQYGIAKNREEVFEYNSFACILDKVYMMYPGKRIGLPYIGMGLAGGDSETILDIIEIFAEDYAETGGTVTLVKYQPISFNKL